MNGWSTPLPGHFTSGKETRYLLYKRQGEPQNLSGRVQKISPPPRFPYLNSCSCSSFVLSPYLFLCLDCPVLLLLLYCTTETPMPSAGFEPAIPASARPLCATRSPDRPASRYALYAPAFTFRIPYERWLHIMRVAHTIYALTCFVSPLLKTAYSVFLSTTEKGCLKENDSFALP